MSQSLTATRRPKFVETVWMNDMRIGRPDEIKYKAFSDSVLVFNKMRGDAFTGYMVRDR
jgi:hypothetical protein